MAIILGTILVGLAFRSYFAPAPSAASLSLVQGLVHLLASLQAAEDETSEPQHDDVPNIAEATGYKNECCPRLSDGCRDKGSCIHADAGVGGGCVPKGELTRVGGAKSTVTESCSLISSCGAASLFVKLAARLCLPATIL